MRLTLALTTLALGVVTTTAHAQYFGRNKVQYRHLDFAVIQTEHFDIYYYEEEEETVRDGGRRRETARDGGRRRLASALPRI